MKRFGYLTAGVVALALLCVGLLIWFDQTPAPPAPPETSPVVSGKGQPLPPGLPAPAKPEAQPEPTSDPASLPVRWWCEPGPIPEAGIPFELIASSGGARYPGGRVFNDRIEFAPELPYGRYRWIDAAPISIARRVGDSQYTFDVNAGQIRLNKGSDVLTVVPLLYMVPVRLEADLVGRTSIRVSVQYTPAEGGDPAFSKTLDLKLGEQQSLSVPRGMLRFHEQRNSGRMLSAEESVVASSLADRLPEPDELVVLTPTRNVELTISVPNQPAKWLETALHNATGETTWDPASCSLQVQLRGWGKNEVTASVDQPLSELLEGPAGAQTLKPITVVVGPLTAEATINAVLTGTSATGDRFALPDAKPLAAGQAILPGGLSAYAIELAPIQADRVLTVKLMDTAGRVRPNFAIEVESIAANAGVRSPARYRRVAYTDSTGLALFTGIPAGAGIGVQARVRPQRHDDASQKVWFTDEEASKEIELVIEAGALQPLVFEFVPDAIPEDARKSYIERAGRRIRLPTMEYEYTITSLSSNSLHGRSGKSYLGDNWLMYTDYALAGPFKAFVTTPYGDYSIDGYLSEGTANVVRIVLEPFREASVCCTDKDGKVLVGVKISTTQQDAQTAWARSAEYERERPAGNLKHFTNKKGVATVRCRSSEADPSTWTYYHADHGLMRAQAVKGNEVDGYTIALATDATLTGTVTVEITADAKSTAKRFYATLRMFGPEDILDARSNLGTLLELTNGKAIFHGVPAGRYQLKVFPTEGTGIESPPADMCMFVDVRAGEAQTVTLPKD